MSGKTPVSSLQTDQTAPPAGGAAPASARQASVLSPVEDIIADARNGRMFILVDDENRENEGDLVIPAQMATPDAINFMAKHGRGLICLSMTQAQCRQLGLPLMPRTNSGRFETAFTVSIEARDGVTTGISAHDRARTISVAASPGASPADIATPGHVFPLVARDGGVLMRAGHTEAAVDICRLAGLHPAGVICEIMNDDGHMARLPELLAFARHHGLRIGSIADLIAYRRRHDHMLQRVQELPFRSVFGGDFRLCLYVNELNYSEHVALVKGRIDAGGGPVLVRMHALSVLDDVLGDAAAGKAGLLQKAMEAVGREGRGVVVLIREPHPMALSERLKQRQGDAPGAAGPLRDYGTGAQILLDLGVREMTLLSDADRNVVGLEGYGLTIAGRRPLTVKEAS